MPYSALVAYENTTKQMTPSVRARLAANLQDETQPEGAALSKKFGAEVLVSEYGAVGNNVTDDSAALVAAITANPGRTIRLKGGTYLVASSTRLLLAGTGTSLVGASNGIGTTIRFSHASGGIDIGDGLNNTYENRLVNINIHGGSVATTVVRCRKMYEPYFNNVRIQSSASSAGSCLLHLDESGQLDADRLTLSTAPIGMKITGTVSPIANLRLANFFELTECVRLASTGISKLALTDSWIEACPDILTINTATAFSVGEIQLSRVRILKVTGNQRVLRAVAATSVNSQIVAIDDCYVDAQASTAPLVDFTALDNAATFNCSMRRTVALVGGTGPLVDTHASQAWYLFHVRAQDLRGVLGDFPSGRIAKTPLATGGTWLHPLRLDGSGTPEGAVSAPPGSTFQRMDGGDLALYIKVSGIGNTGWKPAAMAGSPLIEGPVTVVSTDPIANDFGVNILQVQRSAAEATDPSAVVFGLNGAAQARIGWDDASSQGAMLAQSLGVLMQYGPTAIEVLLGGDLTLSAKSATDNVRIGTGTFQLSIFTTAGRPSASAAGQGSVIYDGTLNLPIYSDGSIWKKYDGTAA